MSGTSPNFPKVRPATTSAKPASGVGSLETHSAAITSLQRAVEEQSKLIKDFSSILHDNFKEILAKSVAEIVLDDLRKDAPRHWTDSDGQKLIDEISSTTQRGIDQQSARFTKEIADLRSNILQDMVGAFPDSLGGVQGTETTTQPGEAYTPRNRLDDVSFDRQNTSAQPLSVDTEGPTSLTQMYLDLMEETHGIPSDNNVRPVPLSILQRPITTTRDQISEEDVRLMLRKESHRESGKKVLRDMSDLSESPLVVMSRMRLLRERGEQGKELGRVNAISDIEMPDSISSLIQVFTNENAEIEDRMRAHIKLYRRTDEVHLEKGSNYVKLVHLVYKYLTDKTKEEQYNRSRTGSNTAVKVEVFFTTSYQSALREVTQTSSPVDIMGRDEMLVEGLKVRSLKTDKLPTLTLSNFEGWNTVVTNVIAGYGHAKAILTGDVTYSDPGYNATVDKHLCGILVQIVGEELHTVRDDVLQTRGPLGSQLYRALRDHCLSKTVESQATALTRIHNLAQLKREGITEYTNRCRGLFNRAHQIGAPISESSKLHHFVLGLEAESMSEQALSIRSSNPVVDWETLARNLRDREDHLKARRRVHQSPQQIPMREQRVGNRWQGRQSVFPGRRAAIAAQAAESHNEETANTVEKKGRVRYGQYQFTGNCHHCGKKGHMVRDCDQHKRDVASGKVQPREQEVHMVDFTWVPDEEEADTSSQEEEDKHNHQSEQEVNAVQSEDDLESEAYWPQE